MSRTTGGFTFTAATVGGAAHEKLTRAERHERDAITEVSDWSPPLAFRGMTIFGGSAEQPPEGGDLVPERPDVELFAHIEGLCGEEAALLATPASEREPHQHDRLRAITAELDRVWERLRDRAEGHGKPH